MRRLTSALAALNLYNGAAHVNAIEREADKISVIAKLGGNVLTVMVIAGGTLKLFRCVALEHAGKDQVTEAEVLSVLQPTFSYVEDELGAPAGRLILCGFRDGSLPGLAGERGELSSRFGTPGAYNAGLLGYLEGLRNG